LKIAGSVLVGLFGAVLLYCSLEFPLWGDPSSPASRHVSPHYIEATVSETAVPNIVTSVLADYRGYDTMFETIVIFTAGLACLLLLRTTTPGEPGVRMYRHVPTGITLRIEKGGKIPEGSDVFERIDLVWVPYDMIVKTTCRLVIPFIQIFALYVIAHGHHSPGGGFQGGVILGASMILYAIGFNLRSAVARVSERRVAVMCALGVFLYAATGALCMLYGGNFLDYGALAHLFGVEPAAAHSLGILLVEIGVGISVMAVMILLYYNLSSQGRLDEGL
jgi:multicomponent Na+:H+ antiporter subunit B